MIQMIQYMFGYSMSPGRTMNVKQVVVLFGFNCAILRRDEEALEVVDTSFSGPRLVSNQRVDDRLPSASTCFFMMKLPKYSSYRVLEAKLRTAITSCFEIDLDAMHHNVDGQHHHVI